MADSKKMAQKNDDAEAFDPFHLHSPEGEAESPGTDRPVAISVSAQRGRQPDSASGTDPPLAERPSHDTSFPSHPDDEHADDLSSNLSPPQVSRVTRSPLPPKLHVKLTVSEQVSSVASPPSGSGPLPPEQAGSSQVSVEGSVYAQLQCSDATQNAPFCLVIQRGSDDSESSPLEIRPNPVFTTVSPLPSVTLDPHNNNIIQDQQQQSFVVQIPKPEIGRVLIAQYSLTEQVRHLPILLERKVTYPEERSCRLALQVRSKLSNAADTKEFSLAVSVPELVQAETIEIRQGNGVYDALKRTLHWKLDSLEKGQSFMVSAQGQLWELPPPSSNNSQPLQFPVLLKCTNAGDAISSLAFSATAAPGHAASVTSTTTRSFSLLHRLP